MSAATAPRRPAIEIMKLPVPGIEGAFIYLSARLPNEDSREASGAMPLVSLVYMGESVAAEWEPRYGPIMLFFKGDDQDHYTFDRIRSRGWDWSQMAVSREGLPGALVRGDLTHCFEVLRRWTEYRGGAE